MTEIAVAHSDSADDSLRNLAVRYGLRPAGLRPTLVAYSQQLWSYRHFINAYANARLVASFTSARLGQVWQVLTPLTNVAVYYLIFGIVLNTSRDVPNFLAYLCTGVFVFTFTQTVVLSGIQAISGNLGLVRALHFPRACLPIAVTITQFQNLLVSMLVLCGVILVTGEPLTLAWLLALPALLLQAVFNAGMALAMARLGAKVTDMKQLMPFVMRTWMYASGVLYSVANFSKHLPHAAAMLMQINPLLIYIELVRSALLNSARPASPLPQLWLLGIGWALLAGVGGFIFFWRGEQEYGRG